MTSLEVIRDNYKPYRYTIKGSSTIIETMTGKYVVKDKGKNDLHDLFNYLKSRSFIAFPNLIEDNRSDVNIFQYVEDVKMPQEQKAMDLVNVVASLHNKTTYFKDVPKDRYQEIYEDINNNILYLQNKYNGLFDLIFEKVYPSPKELLFMESYTKVKNNLGFSKEKLDNWYDKIKDNDKERVALIHNNLTLDHYLKSDKDYLISWDKAKVDSPILDMIKLYQKEYLNINFSQILTKYFSLYPMNQEEKDLFFLMISIPPEINFTNDEFEDCLNLRRILEYISKTEKLIRPYYTENKIEK